MQMRSGPPAYPFNPNGYNPNIMYNNAGQSPYIQRAPYNPAVGQNLQVGMMRNPAGVLKAAPMGQSSAKLLKSYTNLDDNVCSICLIGKPDAITSCRHQFHSECIYGWLQRDKTCPNCRANNFTIKLA